MIRVLASGNAKGDLFVQLLKTLLDKLGFEDITCNVREAGKEVDLRARQKVTRAPLLGEAKAWDRPVGGADVNKFLGSYTGEHSSGGRLSGIFISLYGYTDDARRMRQTWAPELQERLLLLDGADVERALINANLCISDAELERRVTERLNLLQGERYLTWSEHGLRWVQVFDTEERPSHFAIFDAHGKNTTRWICDELQRLDERLGLLQVLDFDAEGKILDALLDGNERTIERIAQDTVLSPQQVELYLRRQDGPVIEKDEWTLRNDLNTYVLMAQRYLHSEKAIRFLASKFGHGGLTRELLQHIEARLGFTLDDARDGVLAVLAVSPTALKDALFGDTSFYAAGATQINKKQLGNEYHRLWLEHSRTRFLTGLLEDFLVDRKQAGHAELLSNKEIRMIRSEIILKLATLNGLYLNTHCGANVFLARAGATMKAGELVAATDKGLFVELGTLLMHMGLYEEAIAEFDKVIKGGASTEARAAAWNNKGLCLEHLNMKEQAIGAYAESCKLNPDLTEPANNLNRIQGANASGRGAGTPDRD